MKFLVAGSGAMGASFGHVLHKAGNEVVLCDNWEESIKMSQERGLIITDVNSREESPLKIVRPEEVEGEFDCVLLFSKSYQLPAMCKQIQHLVGENTKVLCILNGLGHYRTLQKFFAKEQIIMGVTVCTAKLLGPAEFLLSSHSPTEIRNMGDRPEDEAACKAIVDAFNAADMPFSYSQDILFSIWRKACLNGTVNCICSILNCNMELQGQIPYSRELVHDIIVEFARVARVEGTIIDVEKMTDYVCWFLTPEFKGYKHYPSMWQDLYTNSRLTEIDFLNGYVAKEGKAFGLDVKFNELITILIHGKEKVLGIE